MMNDKDQMPVWLSLHYKFCSIALFCWLLSYVFPALFGLSALLSGVLWVLISIVAFRLMHQFVGTKIAAARLQPRPAWQAFGLWAIQQLLCIGSGVACWWMYPVYLLSQASWMIIRFVQSLVSGKSLTKNHYLPPKTGVSKYDTATADATSLGWLLLMASSLGTAVLLGSEFAVKAFLGLTLTASTWVAAVSVACAVPAFDLWQRSVFDEAPASTKSWYQHLIHLFFSSLFIAPLFVFGMLALLPAAPAIAPLMAWVANLGVAGTAAQILTATALVAAANLVLCTVGLAIRGFARALPQAAPKWRFAVNLFGRIAMLGAPVALGLGLSLAPWAAAAPWLLQIFSVCACLGVGLVAVLLILFLHKRLVPTISTTPLRQMLEETLACLQKANGEMPTDTHSVKLNTLTAKILNAAKRCFNNSQISLPTHAPKSMELATFEKISKIAQSPRAYACYLLAENPEPELAHFNYMDALTEQELKAIDNDDFDRWIQDAKITTYKVRFIKMLARPGTLQADATIDSILQDLDEASDQKEKLRAQLNEIKTAYEEKPYDPQFFEMLKPDFEQHASSMPGILTTIKRMSHTARSKWIDSINEALIESNATPYQYTNRNNVRETLQLLKEVNSWLMKTYKDLNITPQQKTAKQPDEASRIVLHRQENQHQQPTKLQEQANGIKAIWIRLRTVLRKLQKRQLEQDLKQRANQMQDNNDLTLDCSDTAMTILNNLGGTETERPGGMDKDAWRTACNKARWFTEPRNLSKDQIATNHLQALETAVGIQCVA